MGFASFLEGVRDRYYQAESLSDIWGAYLGPKATTTLPLHADPLDRPRRLIRDFWTYYERQPVADVPAREWVRHFQNLERLLDILRQAEPLTESTAGAWHVLTRIEGRLRDLRVGRGHR